MTYRGWNCRWCVLLVFGLIPGVETELGWWNNARLERHTRELGGLLPYKNGVVAVVGRPLSLVVWGSTAVYLPWIQWYWCEYRQTDGRTERHRMLTSSNIVVCIKWTKRPHNDLNVIFSTTIIATSLPRMFYRQSALINHRHFDILLRVFFITYSAI